MKKYLLIVVMLLGITTVAVPSVFAEDQISTELVDEDAIGIIDSNVVNETFDSAEPITLPVITIVDFFNATLVDLGGDVSVTAGFDMGFTTSYGDHFPNVITNTGNFGFGIVNPFCGTYHSRAFATNSAGTVYGPDMIFVDHECQLPTVTTRVAYPQFTNAIIEGDVNNGTNDDGGPFSVGFEYGTTDIYGTVINSFDNVGAGLFSQLISGLTCNTEYHFRAMATNREGDVGYGNDMTFTTWPCEDSVVTNDATDITKVSAKLHGILNHNLLTQDGLTTGFIIGTDNYIVSSNSSMGEYEYISENLTCGTEYSFKAYATDSIDTIYGNELHFITLPCSNSGSAGHGGLPACLMSENEASPNCIHQNKEVIKIVTEVKDETTIVDKIDEIPNDNGGKSITPIDEIQSNGNQINIKNDTVPVIQEEENIENTMQASVIDSGTEIYKRVWFWIILFVVIISGSYTGYKKGKKSKDN